MKTTLVIPDLVFRALKRRAVERGVTLSSLVTQYLRRGLAEAPKAEKLPTLPRFPMGRPRVELADREELYRAMEES